MILLLRLLLVVHLLQLLLLGGLGLHLVSLQHRHRLLHLVKYILIAFPRNIRVITQVVPTSSPGWIRKQFIPFPAGWPSPRAYGEAQSCRSRAASL